MTTLTKTSSGGTGLFGSFSPKDLAPRLGTSKEMVRIFLRRYYPETHVKNKAWNISPELAKQMEKDYRNLVQAREAERKLRIQRELAGKLE
jgi:hypothetical protein